MFFLHAKYFPEFSSPLLRVENNEILVYTLVDKEIFVYTLVDKEIFVYTLVRRHSGNTLTGFMVNMISNSAAALMSLLAASLWFKRGLCLLLYNIYGFRVVAARFEAVGIYFMFCEASF